MFAKPFLGSLSGHSDGVYCMAKHAKNLQYLVSGAGDGEVRGWKLNSKECFWSTIGHRGIVKGVSILPDYHSFISVGTDKTAKIWNPFLPKDQNTQPTFTYHSNHPFTGVDHHRSDPVFATSGSVIDIWDVQRSLPVSTFEWGADTISTVKFNQTETNVLASCGSDRAITLYDIRLKSSLHKVVLQLKSNALAWNPMEAYHFAVANEDHNSYLFDMRMMDKAVNIYKDHVSAVMDIDFSPTGQELVTGSYDKSIRLYDIGKSKSRDIYHTKRMQRIFCVKFSMDSKYVLSGSDDTNIRLWKANASEKLGVKNTKEKAYLEYSEKLKDKFKHVPEINKVSKTRYVPKPISKATQTKRIMLDSQKAKEMKREEHAKKTSGKNKKPTAKEKVILYNQQ
jgi:WD repeat and SOF domain-containing protein 1